MKPEIFITRPLTDRVISAAADYFKVTVRSSTLPMSSEEMRKSLCNFDGILPTLGDLYSAAVFTAVPNPRAQILANFGVNKTPFFDRD